jgi:hypothetical protein
VRPNFTFDIQHKILNILHPQPEISLPVALFKLATTLAAYGVCMNMSQHRLLHVLESCLLHFVAEVRNWSLEHQDDIVSIQCTALM